MRDSHVSRGVDGHNHSYTAVSTSSLESLQLRRRKNLTNNYLFASDPMGLSIANGDDRGIRRDMADKGVSQFF